MLWRTVSWHKKTRILASLKCLTSPSALSDMTFTHEGNKTFTDRLVNFEKMVSLQGTYFSISETVLNRTCLIFLVCFFQRMIANTVRIMRYCRSQPFSKTPTQASHHVWVHLIQHFSLFHPCRSRSTAGDW